MSHHAKARPDIGQAASEGQIEPLDLALRAIAERRLAQIEEAFGLRYDGFSRVREAAVPGRDGAGEAILTDQTRRLEAALAKISDPLLRLRLTELLAALADADPD